MRTRSCSARLSVESSGSLPSAPAAALPIRSVKRRSAAASDLKPDSSSTNTPPAKRTKFVAPVASVNRHTAVDLATIDSYLGQLIPIVNGGQAKGGVVAALTQLLPAYSPVATSAVTHFPQPIRLPTFNRLSGWLQLHNALCLFINLPSATDSADNAQPPLSRYNNLFSRRKGRTYCTWYAPASVQPTHPLVATLAAATAQSEVAVLLLCRRAKDSGGGRGSEVTEGYRHYGRVAYVSHDGDVKPIRFVLELLETSSVEAAMLHERQQSQQPHDADDADAT